ncbi:hypothetical protein FRC09_010232, partial [Ceratobasidium sp. 395]
MAIEHVMEVDIIFVGGGTSACVAAGRLAKANPGLQILLVEHGPNNLGNPTVVTPALYMSHLAPTSKTASAFSTNTFPKPCLIGLDFLGSSGKQTSQALSTGAVRSFRL